MAVTRNLLTAAIIALSINFGGTNASAVTIAQNSIKYIFDNGRTKRHRRRLRRDTIKTGELMKQQKQQQEQEVGSVGEVPYDIVIPVDEASRHLEVGVGRITGNNNNADLSMHYNKCHGFEYKDACWYVSSTPGMSCNEVCSNRGLKFDAQAAIHDTNHVSNVFWPESLYTDEKLFPLECHFSNDESETTFINMEANGLLPSGDFVDPRGLCHFSCACSIS